MKTQSQAVAQRSAGVGNPSHAAAILPPFMLLQPAILDQIHDAVLTMDLQGEITGCNRAAREMSGYTAEELIGKNASILYPLEERHLFRSEAISAICYTGEYRSEVRVRTRLGDILHVHTSMSFLSDEEGCPTGMVSFSVNLTSRKLEEAVRQAEKLAAVGRLASSIAHEINNPLHSVTNLLYLLTSDKTLGPTARQYVSTAQEELARVSEVTTQTLRFHQQSAYPAPARLNDILDAVLTFYRPRIRASALQVMREYWPTEQLSCMAADIRQAMGHTVGNAIEASSEGGKLRIRLRPSVMWKDRGRRGVRITIGDTGRGIDKGLLARIFEPFYTTKGPTGTGLGLWITQDLILKHDGCMLVRSSTNPRHLGTVITIFLPFESHKPE